MKLTEKQQEALQLIGTPASDIMLFGGSRSGKTFLLVRVVILRALAAAGSRHAIFRFRLNHVKSSIVYDTFPKVMNLCFEGVTYTLDKTDLVVRFPNGSEVWFGGLDDKERTEKILGQEHATIYLNESSQIPYSSVLLAQTRLAQKVTYVDNGEEKLLRLKMLYDCNPPSQAHWSYKLFIRRCDPETGNPLPNPLDYAAMQMNPMDNAENLPEKYLEKLQNMPRRMKTRFWDGNFSAVAENALWNVETLDKWRREEHPDFVRVVVAVDPSGSGDDDNENNDAIGIVVCGLGTDGNGYLIADYTVKAGPKTWGRVAATAYENHKADILVAELNYGGDMVKFVVKTANPSINFKKLHASRGKTVRAEPISSLHERGKIRFLGEFSDLEDELIAFTTKGYKGDKSPNRADAFVWGMTELFPGMVAETPDESDENEYELPMTGGWMR